jgi:hypothetical protein
VLQLRPITDGTRTAFLTVLTAVEGSVAAPPAAAYRVVGPGRIEVTVDGQSTGLDVPAWFPAP